MSLGRKHGSGDFASILNEWVDDDFSELVWENGQIFVKSQAASVSKAPVNTSSPFVTSGTRSNAVKDQPAFSRAEKFARVELYLHDDLPLIPTGETDLCSNGEVVPWIDYPFGDLIEQRYSPELFPVVSCDLRNVTSTNNSSFPLMENRNGGEESSSSQWLSQSAQTSEVVGSCVSNFISTDTKLQSQNKGVTVPKLVNFSHFSLHSTNPRKPVEAPASVSSAKGNVRMKGKSLAINDDISEHCVTSTMCDSVSKISDFHVPLGPNPNSSLAQPVIDLIDDERYGVSVKDATIISDKFMSSVELLKEIPGDVSSFGTHIACSSVAADADLVSCDERNNSNMKDEDADESESHSNDSITKCAGPKQPEKLSGLKRRRTAEVHNRSERRRRNRINEKLKELQELIPNSIKTDKASMLHQATEYLKMLKHQVQVMSMGAGVCMLPAMFPAPAGMQPMYPSHFMHFPQIGVPDIRFPVSPMQLPQFAMPISGSNSLVSGPTLPLYPQPTQGNQPLMQPPVIQQVQVNAPSRSRKRQGNEHPRSSVASEPVNPTKKH